MIQTNNTPFNAELLEQALALGFKSVAGMQVHNHWLDTRITRNTSEATYQTSADAQARRQAAGVHAPCWVQQLA